MKRCAAGPRWTAPGRVLSRARICGYGHSLRPCQEPTIAPRRRGPIMKGTLSAENHLERCAAARPRPEAEAAADARATRPHVPESLAGRDGHVVEAGAVVDDADDPLVATQADTNVGVPRARVLARVRETLLDDPEHLDLL